MTIANICRESKGVAHTGLFFLLVCGLLLLGNVLGPQMALAGQEEMVEGIMHVKNGSEPADGVETWQVEELWTVGGEDDEDVLFGIITQVQIDDENNIYLLDNQLSEVQVFSPDGEYLRTIGRAGEGPGEVTNPAAMTLLPDGSVGLVRAMPGKLVMLDKEGQPIEDFVPNDYDPKEGGLFLAIRCYPAQGNLIFGGMELRTDVNAGTQERNYHIRSYGMDHERIAEFYVKNVHWNFSNFTLREIDTDFPWQRLDVDDEGRVVMAPERYGYDINIYNSDGTLDRIIERKYESYERTQEIKDLVDRAFQAQMPQLPPGSNYEAETHEPDVAELRIAEDGSIWTQNSRQTWAGQDGEFMYDVFSSDGHFTKQVRIECAGSAREDRLFFAGDGRIYKVSGFLAAAISAQGLGGEDDDSEPEPMAITCYKVK
ncbi:MAG: 6-bladed beta-propeller [Gemmatimonadales bacterium]|nr:6-bladed beta-propeller [Gemmatimonadales bacterium]